MTEFYSSLTAYEDTREEAERDSKHLTDVARSFLGMRVRMAWMMSGAIVPALTWDTDQIGYTVRQKLVIPKTGKVLGHVATELKGRMWSVACEVNEDMLP